MNRRTVFKIFITLSILGLIEIATKSLFNKGVGLIVMAAAYIFIPVFGREIGANLVVLTEVLCSFWFIWAIIAFLLRNKAPKKEEVNT